MVLSVDQLGSGTADTEAPMQAEVADFARAIEAAVLTLATVAAGLQSALQDPGSLPSMDQGGGSPPSPGDSGAGMGDETSSDFGDSGSIEADLRAIEALLQDPQQSADAPSFDTLPAAAQPPAQGPGQPDANPPGAASQPGTSTPDQPSPNTAPAAQSTDDSSPTGPTAGHGPNHDKFKDNFDHPITIGEFTNGGSTTAPTEKITLQPGQTGEIDHENGWGGFDAMADASGNFQPNAARFENKTDDDGKMSWPDASDIDGRNAAISVTDGAALNKGDNKSIADGASADLVTTDAAGNKTIAGWYDGSTDQMKAGGAYMESQLGTGKDYVHPDDDKHDDPAQNPMSGTQSKTLTIEFAPP